MHPAAVRHAERTEYRYYDLAVERECQRMLRSTQAVARMSVSDMRGRYPDIASLIRATACGRSNAAEQRMQCAALYCCPILVQRLCMPARGFEKKALLYGIEYAAIESRVEPLFF